MENTESNKENDVQTPVNEPEQQDEDVSPIEVQVKGNEIEKEGEMIEQEEKQESVDAVIDQVDESNEVNMQNQQEEFENVVVDDYQ